MSGHIIAISHCPALQLGSRPQFRNVGSIPDRSSPLVEPDGRNALDLSEVSNGIEMSVVHIVQVKRCARKYRWIKSLASSDWNPICCQILVETGSRWLMISAKLAID